MVATDGPNGVFVPLSTTDFSDLSLGAPTLLYPCQETSSDLFPVIGTFPFLDDLGATHFYDLTVPGWTRKFVGLPHGADCNFSRVSSSFATSVNESLAVLIYAAVARPTITNGTLFFRSAQSITTQTDGRVFVRHGNVDTYLTQSGHLDEGDPVTVRPWVWYRNTAIHQSGLINDLEWILGRFYKDDTNNELCFGDPSGGTVRAAPCRIGLIAIYKGAAAEQDWSSYLTTLGWNAPTQPTPTRDAVSNIYTPLVEAEFDQLELATPTLAYPCSDTEDPLEPSIGSDTLTENSTGHVYGDTVTGWMRRFVGLSAYTFNLRWGRTGLVDLASGESCAVLGFFGFQDPPADGLPHWLFQVGNSENGVYVVSSGRVSARHNDIAIAADTGRDGAGFPIFPVVWFRRADTNQSGVITDQTRNFNTHYEGTLPNDFLILGSGGSSGVDEASLMRCGYFLLFRGAAANQEWGEYLWRLGWDVEWFRPGELNQTLADATLSADGDTEVQGTLTRTLATATVVAAGTNLVRGVTTSTLAGITRSAAGTVPNNGVVTRTLAAATSVAPGTVLNNGVVTRTLSAATSVAPGTTAVVGLASATLQGITPALDGNTEIQGTATVQLGTAVVTASGALDVQSLAVVGLDAVGPVATGTVTIEGQTAVTLAAATSSAAGDVDLEGAGAVALAAATSLATGGVAVVGDGAANLEVASIVATAQAIAGGVADVVLGEAVVTASGALDVQSLAVVGLDAVGPVATGTVSLSGALTVQLEGVLPALTVAVDVVAQATLQLEAAAIEATSQALVNGVADVVLAEAAPAVAGELDIVSEAAADLAASVLTATGTVAIASELAAQTDDVTSLSAGTVDLVAQVALELNGVSQLLDGVVTITGQSLAPLSSVALLSELYVLSELTLDIIETECDALDGKPARVSTAEIAEALLHIPTEENDVVIHALAQPMSAAPGLPVRITATLNRIQPDLSIDPVIAETEPTIIIYRNAGPGSPVVTVAADTMTAIDPDENGLSSDWEYTMPGTIELGTYTAYITVQGSEVVRPADGGRVVFEVKVQRVFDPIGLFS
jgi:hypothetical protein